MKETDLRKYITRSEIIREILKSHGLQKVFAKKLGVSQPALAHKLNRPLTWRTIQEFKELGVNLEPILLNRGALKDNTTQKLLREILDKQNEILELLKSRKASNKV